MSTLPCLNSVTWTPHGELRLHQRIKLSKNEVNQLIICKCFIELKEEKKKRLHLLMYSYSDRFPFVLIIDFKFMEVVTLLPIDYYQNLNFIIPLNLLNEIEQITRGFMVKISDISNENEKKIEAKFSEKYKVSAYFSSVDKSKFFCRKINSFLKYKFGFRIENLVSSSSFIDSLLFRLYEINQGFDQNLLTFGTRLNSVFITDKSESYSFRPQEFVFYPKIQMINSIYLKKIYTLDQLNHPIKASIRFEDFYEKLRYRFISQSFFQREIC